MVRHGADHLGDGRVPALEGVERLVRPNVAHGPGTGPGLRTLDHREVVDILALAADRVVQQVRVRTNPELDGLRVRQCRQLPGRHDAAEGAGPGVGRALAPGDPLADGRAHAVRPDHEVRLRGLAVGKLERDAVALVDEALQPVSQVQPLAAERAVQDALQVGAVDAEIGCAETLLVAQAVSDGMGGDAASVLPAPVDQLGRLGGHGSNLVEHAKAAQLPRRVGRQRHRRADLGQLRSLLENRRFQPALPERQGERQAADAAADDRYPKPL